MINDIAGIKNLYGELLSVIPEGYKDPIYPFFVQVGGKYYTSNLKCLFIGKSVNGWVTDSTNLEELFDQNNPNRIVNRHDQMNWVNDLEGPNEVYEAILKNTCLIICT